MWKKKSTFQQIEATLSIPMSTAKSIVKKFRRTGSVEDLPCSGRPPKLDSHHQKLLARACKKNPEASGQELLQEVFFPIEPPDVGKHALSRYLSKTGLKSYRRSRKPHLTAAQKQKRLQFARTYKSMDWRRVIFSDEKRFRPGFDCIFHLGCWH